MLKIQLRLKFHDSAYRRNNSIVAVLRYNTKLGLDTFLYSNNNNQPASEYHNFTSQALTNTKGSKAKQANLRRTSELLYNIGVRVLLSTNNINIKKVSLKMKPIWIGLLTITTANYINNHYSLNLSTDPSQNVICNGFHICIIKAYMNNNSTLFPQCELAKTGPVTQDRYEVQKVLEYRKTLRTSIPQYKIYWFGYALADEPWINAADICTIILQDF